MSTGQSTRFNPWSGWVTFAACMMLVLGVLNIFEGCVALFRSGYYQTASGNLLVWNFTAWGAVLIAFGALQVLIGGGLFTGKSWARWAAIVLAILNIFGQIGFLAAHPVWTTIMLALDVIVLWALTAHWHSATAGMEADWRERRGMPSGYGRHGDDEWRAGHEGGARATAGGREERSTAGGTPSDRGTSGGREGTSPSWRDEPGHGRGPDTGGMRDPRDMRGPQDPGRDEGGHT